MQCQSKLIDQLIYLSPRNGTQNIVNIFAATNVHRMIFTGPMRSFGSHFQCMTEHSIKLNFCASPNFTQISPTTMRLAQIRRIRMHHKFENFKTDVYRASSLRLEVVESSGKQINYKMQYGSIRKCISSNNSNRLFVACSTVEPPQIYSSMCSLLCMRNRADEWRMVARRLLYTIGGHKTVKHQREN